MLALRCIHICNKVNSSKNRKRVLQYTFTTGNHQLRKVVVPRTDPEVLLVRQRPRESEILCELTQILCQ